MAKSHKRSSAALLADKSKETAGAPALGEVIRGTLLRYRLTCGNLDCRCHKSKRYRHGPYWYVGVSYAKGRQRRYLLREDQVQRAREGIAAYKKLWKALCRISEINLALLKTERS
jgi:hypothetical protein